MKIFDLFVAIAAYFFCVSVGVIVYVKPILKTRENRVILHPDKIHAE